METRSAHEVAIDWALSRGYNMSVKDRWVDDEWDLIHSYDRDEILEACQATDLPNVYIYNPMWDAGARKPQHAHLLTFAVIDEGVPEETINDYTIPVDDAAEWRKEAFKAFEAATHYSHWEESLTEYRVRVDFSFLMEATVKATDVEDAERQASELSMSECEPVATGVEIGILSVVAT